MTDQRTRSRNMITAEWGRGFLPPGFLGMQIYQPKCSIKHFGNAVCAATSRQGRFPHSQTGNYAVSTPNLTSTIPYTYKQWRFQWVLFNTEFFSFLLPLILFISHLFYPSWLKQAFFSCKPSLAPALRQAAISQRMGLHCYRAYYQFPPRMS